LNPFYKNLSLWIVIVLMTVMLYSLFNQREMGESNLNYSQFLSMVENDQVSQVVIQGNELIITDYKGNRYQIYAPRDPDLIKSLKEKNVTIKSKPPQESPWYLSVLISWFPMIVLIGIWIFFMRQMQSGGGKALSFGKSRARLLSENSEKVTFDDVAGIDEAKEELYEIIEFLKDPKKYTRLGGRIPKGVLLTGPPGNGKTLLARAIAGEAGVPFFSISGSDFVEMFVGVGASRVRDLFIQGKKNAPCIIFVDEIDAVGRHRGAGLGGGHDEREQTLNQLLVEMDGFESNEGVILISATNRPDVLDPALTRPGRFDRQIDVSLPDVNGRKKILEVHMKKSPMADNIEIDVLAKGTPGFTGADLENLVNEAALLAARRNKERVEMVDLEDAKDKVYMGLERKSRVITEDEKKKTAYHEAGHAVVARILPETDPINKVTIIPRGRALGVTWFLSEERVSIYKDQLESRLAVLLAGRIAEELVFQRISAGAANDIRVATEIAQNMVREYGMSETLGPRSYAKNQQEIFIGREIAQHRDYSDETAKVIDKEIDRFIRGAYAKAQKVLHENMDCLHKVAETLLEKETILGRELDDIIRSVRPDIILTVHPQPEEEAEEKAAPENTEPSTETEKTESPTQTGESDDPEADTWSEIDTQSDNSPNNDKS
jgi:cell division protease FtsH